jgi:hypothetical protein
MDREALRRRRRGVRVRLHREAEPRLEPPAEHRRGPPVQVQRLQHDRRPARVLIGDARDVGDAGEARRPPRDVVGVARRRQRRAVADEPEGRRA